MKNFKLIKGKLTALGMILIHVESKTIYAPYSRYIEVLHKKGLSINTINSYARHTAQFLDFLFELTVQSRKEKNTNAPQFIFDLYYDLLIDGRNSENTLISRIAISLQRETVSNAIISGQIEAALTYYFELLKIEKEHAFFELFEYEHSFTERQKFKIQKSSWLSQCIRTTDRSLKAQVRVKLFPRASSRQKAIRKSDSFDTFEKGMPSNDAFELLLKQQADLRQKMSLSKSRGYLIDSMLAASGIRISEGLQVLISDINTKDQKLKIVDVNKRKYKGLTPHEKERLVSKGRATEKTLLIEPFATMFWDALKVYLDNFYKDNMGHDFLLQKSNGRPYFASDESQRYKDLKNRFIKHMGTTFATKYAFHSFRHMYGIYTRNHLPLVDEQGNKTGKFGLPAAYVQILLGHATPAATEIYGGKDTSVAQLLISLANNKIKFDGLTLGEIIQDCKIKQLESIEKEYKRIEGKGLKHD